MDSGGWLRFTNFRHEASSPFPKLACQIGKKHEPGREETPVLECHSCGRIARSDALTGVRSYGNLSPGLTAFVLPNDTLLPPYVEGADPASPHQPAFTTTTPLALTCNHSAFRVHTHTHALQHCVCEGWEKMLHWFIMSVSRDAGWLFSCPR